MDFTWLAEIEELSPAALTVRAQALPPDDNGRLFWTNFFPRQNVDSVDLKDVTILDDRPVAARREWNTRGRHVPPVAPMKREVSILPVEAYDTIGEKEIQKLYEATDGNQELMQARIGVRIPDRSDRLAMAVYRTIELDSFEAWLNGRIRQKDPATGAEYIASFDFAAGRIETALTPWGTGGTNAYDEFVAWYEDALSDVGLGAGAAMRRSMMRRILRDAPQLAGGVRMSYGQLADRISDDVGQPFIFYLMESHVDDYVDGGIVKQRVQVWPADTKVAFVPADERVGNTAFAPVARAMDISRQAPEARVDRRGIAVFHEAANGYRQLTIEAQGNPLSIPEEQRVRVIDAGAEA